ncbi:MAG: thioredoxin family protein [Bacteroidales bacterium]|nr:MAG: thioredoxin family protein [Bacteroidales bacterium]
MKRYIIILTGLILLVYSSGISQIFNPVKWNFKSEKISSKYYNLVFEATIDTNWHLYGLNIPENGPIATSIVYTDSTGFKISGKPVSVTKPEIKFDPVFGLDLELYSNKAIFKQQIEKATGEDLIVKGYVEFMSCDDQRCLPPKEAEFELFLADAKTEILNKSLLGILLISILAGLGALLTPCVYPMIPLTVSFFMRGQKTRLKTISEALVFGISIIFIYTVIGIIVALLKNPNAVNSLNTHWIPNILFFVIFIILSISFFGAFEIILPSGLAGKIDKQADRGGYIGAFFMALAMTILSFSCTGPIVASLLIKASQGEVLEPVVGMFGFSFIFAVPFTLLAIFPSWLKNLPKSGGWLNSVKVFLAFIMLAFAFYFIGRIEQTYHLKIISRDLFIAIWIVIFALLGFYLLGKIKFSHDSEVKHISVSRLFLSIISFSFVVYMIPGLFGAELRGISVILPPKEIQKFDLSKTGLSDQQSLTMPGIKPDNSLCVSPKYSDFLHLPHGLEGYYVYEEALSCAKQQNKPVLVDFVGHSCTNCKKMYNKVWSDTEVLEILKNDFVIVALYVDDKTKLSQSEWITSSHDGKVKKTIGKKNADFQVSKFKSNALPLYAIVDHTGDMLTEKTFTYDRNVNNFIKWLKEGKENFNN